MPYVFVGTKDYATGLMDANSLGISGGGGTGVDSTFTSSFYPTKSMMVGSVNAAIALIPSVAGFANSVDVSSFYPTKAMMTSSLGLKTNSTDVSSFYALKTSLPTIVTAAQFIGY